MQYLLLINASEAQEEKFSEAEMGQLMADYGKFDQELQEAGVCQGSDRLRPVATATTVRVRSGDVITSDGPFAETKEQLGGYFLIDVKDLDEAIHWAAKIPSARYGCVEVRPIWDRAEYMPSE